MSKGKKKDTVLDKIGTEHASKIVGFFNFFISIFITMDSDLTSIKMRRAFSAIIDIAFCSAIYYIFYHFQGDYFKWKFFLTVVVVYFFIEGILGSGMLGKQLTSLKVVIEDFAQEDEKGNKQKEDFELARICLRGLIKSITLGVIVSMFYDNNALWFIVSVICWFMFRFSEGSRMPHDVLTGTHVDCKTEGYYEDITENKVYLNVDKVLDSVFKNMKMNTENEEYEIEEEMGREKEVLVGKEIDLKEDVEEEKKKDSVSAESFINFKS